MMKEIIKRAIAMAITAVICMGVITVLNRPKSDIKIMKDYVAERYGDEYYGLLYADDGDDMVEFNVYKKDTDKVAYSVSVRRSMFD